MGWKAADSSHPATHMIISNEEYVKVYADARRRAEEEYYEEAANAKSDALKIKKEYESKLDMLQTESMFQKQNAEIKEAKILEAARKEAVQIREEAEEEANKIIKAAEKQALKFERINWNLVRIMQERSNAKRKLKNKKSHPGYIIIKSHKCTHRYGWSNNCSIEAWVTTLQTPVDAGCDYETAEYLIFEDLDSFGILNNMGIFYYAIDEESKGNPETVKADYEDNSGYEIPSNYVYNYKLEADYIHGFWNIVIYHTEEAKITEEIRKPTSYA